MPHLRLEALEDRATPATLVSPTILTYQDLDGDSVRVSFSKPILTPANALTIFTFDTGSVNGNNTVGQQLRAINLVNIAAAKGTDIAVVVAATSGASDGFVDVGRINATGIDLGTVEIGGDLGKVLAGNTSPNTPGIQSLKVKSIGKLGTATQGGGDLQSAIVGKVYDLVVTDDFANGKIQVSGGGAATISNLQIGHDVNGVLDVSGRVGTITVGGDVRGGLYLNGGADSIWIGGSVIATTGPLVGQVVVNKSVGDVHIVHDVVGGDAKETGKLQILGNADTIYVGGSIVGGTAEAAGDVNVSKTVHDLTVAGDIVGGDFSVSGRVYVSKSAGTIEVLGNIIGGGGFASALVQVDGPVGRLDVYGDVVGGTGERSAQVDVSGTVGSYTIHGNLIGGSGVDSAEPFVGKPRILSIGGSIQGGSGDYSARISIWDRPKTLTLTIGGDMVGGTGKFSGEVSATAVGATVRFGGDIRGGDGQRSGELWFVDKPTKSFALSVTGSIVGGNGTLSGRVAASASKVSVQVGGDIQGGGGGTSGIIAVDGQAQLIRIGGSVLGGAGGSSGQVDFGPVQAVEIGGSIIGGSGESSANVHFTKIDNFHLAHDLVGGTNAAAGVVTIDGSMTKSVVIGGSILGGSRGLTGRLTASGSINSLFVGGDIRGGVATAAGQHLEGTGSIVVQQDIAQLTIAGSLVGANTNGFSLFSMNDSGFIHASGHLGAVQILGDIVGNDGRARISAGGYSNGRIDSKNAIGSLTVQGRVENADILAGYSMPDGRFDFVIATNTQATIGSVQVGGDWIASNLGAGIDVLTGAKIGPSNPTKKSRISSVAIGGTVQGTAATGDNYFFSAQQIDSITVGGIAVGPLAVGPGNDLFNLGTTGDVQLKEVV